MFLMPEQVTGWSCQFYDEIEQYLLVGGMGLEPMTIRLKVECSTN